MKRKILTGILLNILVVSNFSALSAQDGMGMRGLFMSKQADGLEVKLADVDGKWLDPNREFRQGDKIKIDFRSNFDGYVYFVNVTPGRVTKVLACEEVEADKSYLLPSRGYMEFDEETGTEVLQVVLARSPIKTYDQALKKTDGILSDKLTSPSLPLGEPVGIVASPCAGTRNLVLASGQQVGCRSLVLASGNPAKNEGSVVAISDKQGTKLSQDQIAPFELRLKHIGMSAKSSLSQKNKRK